MTENMTVQELVRLNRECQQKYGQDWIYDVETAMCIYLGDKSLVQLPVERKKIIKIKL